MSFSHKYRTLKSGNFYDLDARPELSAHEEQTTTTFEMNESERNIETTTGFSPEMIEEKIKANLEPLHAQISTLTQMMGKLIQGISAREFPTTSTREPRFSSESPLTEGSGSSRTHR